jgi:putative glutamine amidotransferase
LGTCLGCQVVNVARGGTLVQYLPDRPDMQPHHLPDCYRRHDVRVTGPMLRQILGCDTVAVNSRHQQAVDQTGRDLRVAAVSGDGVVEAVEDTQGRFVLGLQWHPEYFPEEASTRAIMAAFLQAAADARSAPGA